MIISKERRAGSAVSKPPETAERSSDCGCAVSFIAPWLRASSPRLRITKSAARSASPRSLESIPPTLLEKAVHSEGGPLWSPVPAQRSWSTSSRLRPGRCAAVSPARRRPSSRRGLPSRRACQTMLQNVSSFVPLLFATNCGMLLHVPVDPQSRHEPN